MTTFGDKVEAVVSGDGVVLAPAGTSTTVLRPDLTTVPAEGIAPSEVVLVTRRRDERRLVATFVALAATTSPPPR